MDFIEIVIDGEFPVGVDRDDVEDALNDALEGIGEVTGAGSGEGLTRLAVEVDPGSKRSEVLDIVFAILLLFQVGDAARVRPGDGDTWIRPSEWP